MVKPDKHNASGYVPKEEERGLFITAFCDASYCSKTKAWGIGIWIKRGTDPYNKAETFSYGGLGVFTNSTMVESHAIHVTLGILKEGVTEGKILSLQSDCTSAFEYFNEDIVRDNLQLKRVKFKHVRAHTGKANKRSVVNSIVDNLAKKEMRKHRDNYLKENQ